MMDGVGRWLARGDSEMQLVTFDRTERCGQQMARKAAVGENGNKN